MKIMIGFLLVALGVIIIIYCDRSVGKYGAVSKWFFDPPYLTDKYKAFGKEVQEWILGGLMIFFGIMLLLGSY